MDWNSLALNISQGRNHVNTKGNIREGAFLDEMGDSLLLKMDSAPQAIVVIPFHANSIYFALLFLLRNSYIVLFYHITRH
jgi:hypothetical protein